jgi:PilZ domain
MCAGRILCLGRRRQTRTEIALRVQLWGTDANGHPFLEVVCTEDLSERGAHLKGICMPLRCGDLVGLTYNGRQAQFRVVWVGEEGSSYESHAGLIAAGSSAAIWDVNLAASGPDHYTAPTAGDRRHFPRFRCFISALIRVPGSQVPMWGQVTDISQGGCYVQLPNPLPSSTKVEIELLMKVARLRADGVVCSSHTGRGMGVHFVDMSNEYRDQVRQFVKWFAGISQLTASAEERRRASHTP